MEKVAKSWEPAVFSPEQPVVTELTLKPSLTILGKITSQFLQKQESEEKQEVEDLSPWLSLWQPYNPWHGHHLPQPLPGLGDPIDVYIDSVRLLPEHVLLAKVLVAACSFPPLPHQGDHPSSRALLSPGLRSSACPRQSGPQSDLSLEAAAQGRPAEGDLMFACSGDLSVCTTVVQVSCRYLGWSERLLLSA